MQNHPAIRGMPNDQHLSYSLYCEIRNSYLAHDNVIELSHAYIRTNCDKYRIDLFLFISSGINLQYDASFAAYINNMWV